MTLCIASPQIHFDHAHGHATRIVLETIADAVPVVGTSSASSTERVDLGGAFRLTARENTTISLVSTSTVDRPSRRSLAAASTWHSAAETAVAPLAHAHHAARVLRERRSTSTDDGDAAHIAATSSDGDGDGGAWVVWDLRGADATLVGSVSSSTTRAVAPSAAAVRFQEAYGSLDDPDDVAAAVDDALAILRPALQCIDAAARSSQQHSQPSTLQCTVMLHEVRVRCSAPQLCAPRPS
jgi:hypothetical protein